MSNVSSVIPDANDDAIFYTSPRTLLELASIKMAFQIWQEKFTEIYAGKNDANVDIFRLEFEAENLIQVPVAVRKMIELWLPVISRELKSWFVSFRYALNHLETDDIYSRFNLVAFGGNGTVHFKGTIENFLKDDSLSNLTKFEIACVFCVEEKIDFFWPLVCDQLSIENMQFFYDYSMYYWICRKTGELCRIPLEEFSSIEHLMIDKCSRLPIRLAIEYFLARLDSNDRLDQIVRLFDSSACVQYARYLLPYFEAPLQRHVVLMEWFNILEAFVDHCLSFDYATQMWLYIKNSITGEQFCEHVILRFIRVRNENHCWYSNKLEYGQVEMILAEIWSNSPRYLKEFILNFNFPDVLNEIAEFRGDLLKNFGRDVSLALAILSDTDNVARKKFWHENWSKWIVGVSPAQLDQMMTLCLVNTEAIESFKRNLKDSKTMAKYCDTLVTRGFHDELSDLLSYFYTEEREALDIKMELLTTNNHLKNCIFKPKNIEKIQEFVQFVGKLLSNNFLVEDFENQLLSIKDDLNIFYNLAQSSSDIKLIAETIILPEKLEEFKGILWAMFRNTIIKGELYGFDESNCRNFFNWFANGDGQQIRTLLESLPIEDIFEIAVSNCLADEPYAKYGMICYSYKCWFKDLNKFLGWYFESTSLCENFKRQRVRYYERMSKTDVEKVFNVDKEFAIDLMNREMLNLKRDN